MKEHRRRSDPQRPDPLPEIRFRDENGNLRKELLTTEAQSWAERFGNPMEGKIKLTNHQIRRFYNEVKALEAKIQAAEEDFAKNEALVLVHMLRAKVAYARNKSGEGRVPGVFKDFIDKCVKKIDEAGDEDKAKAFGDFARFFEAVIGFANLKER